MRCITGMMVGMTLCVSLRAQDIPRTVDLPTQHENDALRAVDRDAERRGERSAAWTAFRGEHADWHAIWNAWTYTPDRAWGSGVRIPGISSIDRSNIEDAARVCISTLSGLLRTDGLDLALVDAHRYLGRWAVDFRQTYRGIPVEFSEVTLRITDDARVFLFGSKVYPDIDIDTQPAIARDLAPSIAATGLSLPTGGVARIAGGDLSIFPVESEYGIVYHLAYEFVVPEDDFHIWNTWMDARTGEILWRYNRVIDGIHGQVTAQVKTSSVLDTPTSENIFAQNMKINNVDVATDTAGMYTSTNYGTVVAQLRGPYARISRQDAADAMVQTNVANNGTYDLQWTNQNSHTAERTTFYNVNRVRRFITTLDTSLHLLDYQMLCKVNVNQVCNANWDGSGLNFYRAGTSPSGTCPATGDMPDVVMHEYGHAINDKTYIQYGKANGLTNAALHEGLADVNAAMILDRSQIGVGFFGPGTILRDLDNTNRYPDDIVNESHTDGLIIGGACWDMRQRLGLDLARRLSHFARHGKPDDTNTGKAFTKYFLEVLAADDNDGNLANGTPHASDIVPAFAKHGIPQGMLSIAHTPIGSVAASTPIPITASVTSALTQIATQSVRVWYRPRGGVWSSTSLTMTSGVPGGTSAWSGTIPSQLGGTILEYYLEATETWGTSATYPSGGASKPLLLLVGFSTRAFLDCESSQGWQAGVNGDDALTGIWVDDDPVGTYVGTEPVQPENDHSPAPGTKCWVTGNGAVNGAPGDNDVDSGRTTLLSPTFQTAALNVPVLRYWRWFSNDLGAAPRDDPWDVGISSDNGETLKTVEHTYEPLNAWTQIVVPVADYVTPTNFVRLKFVAQDEDPQSLVEAAVDDVELLYVEPTPIELQSLSAARRDRTIEVSWSTATETENAGFDVQYRRDGEEDWQTAGFVTGHGTTVAAHEYRYAFGETSGRELYVRLRQVDFDGTETYSPVVRVSAGPLHFALGQNYPNPFKPVTRISFELDAPSSVVLSVRNLLGVEILRRDLGDLPSGTHDVRVDLAGSPSGVYTYELRAGERTETRSMLLAR